MRNVEYIVDTMLGRTPLLITIAPLVLTVCGHPKPGLENGDECVDDGECTSGFCSNSHCAVPFLDACTTETCTGCMEFENGYSFCTRDCAPNGSRACPKGSKCTNTYGVTPRNVCAPTECPDRWEPHPDFDTTCRLDTCGEIGCPATRLPGAEWTCGVTPGSCDALGCQSHSDCGFPYVCIAPLCFTVYCETDEDCLSLGTTEEPLRCVDNLCSP